LVVINCYCECVTGRVFTAAVVVFPHLRLFAHSGGVKMLTDQMLLAALCQLEMKRVLCGRVGAPAAASAAIHSGVQVLCLTLPTCLLEKSLSFMQRRSTNPKEYKGEREWYM
jgi:hypothetical protein